MSQDQRTSVVISHQNLVAPPPFFVQILGSNAYLHVEICTNLSFKKERISLTVTMATATMTSRGKYWHIEDSPIKKTKTKK